MVVLGFLVVVGWLFWLAVIVVCIIDRFVWRFLAVGFPWWQSVVVGCDWVWGAVVVGSLFIVVVVVYYSGYIILLYCLYYFIMLKAKIKLLILDIF